MEFEICTRNTSYPYRGALRSLSALDFKGVKKGYDALLSCYFEYEELMYETDMAPSDSRSFCKAIELYKKIQGFGVPCELVVYDTAPLKDAYGMQIELLGIDIVGDRSESLLESPDWTDDTAKALLNPHGLCEDLDHVKIVMQHAELGDLSWEPYWVYRVDVPLYETDF